MIIIGEASAKPCKGKKKKKKLVAGGKSIITHFFNRTECYLIKIVAPGTIEHAFSSSVKRPRRASPQPSTSHLAQQRQSSTSVECVLLSDSDTDTGASFFVFHIQLKNVYKLKCISRNAEFYRAWHLTNVLWFGRSIAWFWLNFHTFTKWSKWSQLPFCIAKTNYCRAIDITIQDAFDLQYFIIGFFLWRWGSYRWI